MFWFCYVTNHLVTGRLGKSDFFSWIPMFPRTSSWEKLTFSGTWDHSFIANCYASKLKYIFGLKCNVSRVVGQSSLTLNRNENFNLRPHVIRSCAVCLQTNFSHFFLFWVGKYNKTGNSEFCFLVTSISMRSLISLVRCDSYKMCVNFYTDPVIRWLLSILNLKPSSGWVWRERKFF